MQHARRPSARKRKRDSSEPRKTPRRNGDDSVRKARSKPEEPARNDAEGDRPEDDVEELIGTLRLPTKKRAVKYRVKEILRANPHWANDRLSHLVVLREMAGLLIDRYYERLIEGGIQQKGSGALKKDLETFPDLVSLELRIARELPDPPAEEASRSVTLASICADCEHCRERVAKDAESIFDTPMPPLRASDEGDMLPVDVSPGRGGMPVTRLRSYRVLPDQRSTGAEPSQDAQERGRAIGDDADSAEQPVPEERRAGGAGPLVWEIASEGMVPPHRQEPARS